MSGFNNACTGLLALTFGALGLAMAPTQARADTDLILCNKTGAKLFIAVVYQDAQTGRWMLSAWLN